jgi:hypothetical protein
MSYYLVIVGTRDNPIYEAILTSSRSSQPQQQQQQPSPTSAAATSVFGALGGIPSTTSSSAIAGQATSPSGLKSNAVGYGPRTAKHVMQLVAHASLDIVEDVQWSNGLMYVVYNSVYCLHADPIEQVPQERRQVSGMECISLVYTWRRVLPLAMLSARKLTVVLQG